MMNNSAHLNEAMKKRAFDKKFDALAKKAEAKRRKTPLKPLVKESRFWDW